MDTNGSADQKAIKDKYSAYAFTVFLNLTGLPTIATTLNSNSVFTNTGGWWPCKNGVCVRDTFYNFGGYCYFFNADDCSDDIAGFPAPAAPTTNKGIEVYALTDAQFTTVMTGSYTSGYAFYDAVVGGSTELGLSGEPYFDFPVCTEFDTDVWMCQQY